MSVIAECHLPNCLDFVRRGVPYPEPGQAYDDELYNFFESRLHYQDDCVGVIKSFRKSVAWATKRVGPERVKLCQMVRNPRFNFVGKWAVKASRVPLAKMLGYEPRDEYERFEATAIYYVRTFYHKWLHQASRWPMIRLEDLNASVGSDGDYFQRFMEWLTGVEWPTSYINHIREHNTAAYKYRNWVEWDTWPDGRERVKSVNTVQLEIQQWLYRHNWNEDPEVPWRWARLDKRQQEIYLRHIGPYEQRLGYNQAYVGSTDAEWEGANAAPWD
jgi:hypothetical protein